ncbi:hypothetical protein [Novosphingobium colocasiae]|uniref:hypothetical protein n=1 Tax=Novosphingobium colocasiae TaxID=1256513 RepID=UPI0035AE93F4
MKGTLFAISGWATAAFMGFLNLPGAINNFVDQFPTAAERTGIWLPLDHRITGDWSEVRSCTQNHVDLPDLTKSDEQLRPQVGVDLHLEVQRNMVSGSILSNGLSANAPFPEAVLAGVVDGTTARLQVFDWVGGKPVVFSEVEIRRTRSGCLKLDVVSPADPILFPKSSILAKQPQGYFDSLPREGGVIRKVFDDAVKDVQSHRKK